MRIIKFAEFPQIGTEFFRRHGGIFPAFPRQVLARHPRGSTKARFAHFPNLCRVPWVIVKFHTGRAGFLFQGLHRPPRFIVRLFFCVAALFDQQPTLAFGQIL